MTGLPAGGGAIEDRSRELERLVAPTWRVCGQPISGALPDLDDRASWGAWARLAGA